jgi:small subunit ribosomal protein S16
MATAIRLSRFGRKNRPFYRIVVVDKRQKQRGKYIENIGFYDPLTQPFRLELKKDRFDYWCSQGAIISEGLEKLLKAKKD